jgi:predicted esterase
MDAVTREGAHVKEPDPSDPHRGQTVRREGISLHDARLAIIMLHGRGGSADDLLALSHEFRISDVAYLAPQASGRTWYPNSFLAPIDQNEPGLSSGLGVIAGLVEGIAAQGVPADRVVLMGFSQGACLMLEFAARHAQRYGGIAALSGGLIGPPGTPRNYAGSFNGTPVFIGCSDVDTHVPLERVRESAEVLRHMEATVDERIYRGMGHTVNEDELRAVEALLLAAV